MLYSKGQQEMKLIKMLILIWMHMKNRKKINLQNGLRNLFMSKLKKNLIQFFQIYIKEIQEIFYLHFKLKVLKNNLHYIPLRCFQIILSVCGNTCITRKRNYNFYLTLFYMLIIQIKLWFFCNKMMMTIKYNYSGIELLLQSLSQRIYLNQYIDDNNLTECHKKASLSVKLSKQYYNKNQTQSKIIYIHSLTSDIIFEIQCCKNLLVRKLERIQNLDINLNTENNRTLSLQKIKSIYQNNQRIEQYHVCPKFTYIRNRFMIVGGEFQNDSSICNIIEIVKLQFSQPKYHSYILKKESIFAFNSFIPWPYMIVLANKQSPCQYIFLPGDYGNKLNWYDQPIVNLYQNYGYKLTTPKDNLKFEWQKLNFTYDNSDLHEDPTLGKVQPIPLQYFSSNQSNILCLDNSKKTSWIVAKTFNEQLLLGYTGKAEFNRNQNDFDSASFDDNFKQLTIVAKIYEIENILIVKEKFYDTNNELAQQKEVLNINNQTYLKHYTLQNEF